MHFIRSDASSGTRKLSATLAAALSAGKRVLWLISGGSNIPITVEAMRQIPSELTSRLSITPIDERYGPAGHADSNVRQLQDAGFNPKQARFIPILDGNTLEATTNAYARRMEELFAKNEIVVGQFGIGADGHTAGILPHSPAAEEEHMLATSYQGPDFTRITLTFPALRRITTAYAFAYGPGKRAAMQRLRQGAASYLIQPAQILRAIPETYVFTDITEQTVADRIS